MASPQTVTPRRSRGFSLRSDRSHRSSGSGNKLAPQESHDEKTKRNLHTKADPLVAMSEAQPMAVALEKSNLASLRAMQHKDQYGNLITDPDLSNPCRPRFERPLDTIRSFEAAIYGSYASRPVSYVRTDEGDYSRRTSYYGGNLINRRSSTPLTAPVVPNGANRGYSDQAARGSQSRPDSYIDAYGSSQPPDNYYPYNQGRPRPPRQGPRANSEQAYMNNAQNGYQNGYQRSYENVASGSGSNTEPWNNSTDPSSVNSSIDQLQHQQRMEERAAAEYGFQGFGSAPDFENGGPNTNGAPYGGAPHNGVPAPARHPYEKPLPNLTSGDPVGGSSAMPQAARRVQRKAANTSDNSEKRKSWFKRRFSKG